MTQKITSTVFGLGLAVVATGMAVGCWIPLGCSDMGCVDGVRISLQPPLTEEGSYKVVLDFRDERLECEVVPDQSCDNGIYVETRRRVYEVQAGGTTRTMVETLPGIESISMTGTTPKKFTVRVYRDDVEVLSETLTPSYRKNHPNGEECDGDYFCRNAGVTVSTD